MEGSWQARSWPMVDMNGRAAIGCKGYKLNGKLWREK